MEIFHRPFTAACLRYDAGTERQAGVLLLPTQVSLHKDDEFQLLVVTLAVLTTKPIVRWVPHGCGSGGRGAKSGLSPADMNINANNL